MIFYLLNVSQITRSGIIYLEHKTRTNTLFVNKRFSSLKKKKKKTHSHRRTNRVIQYLSLFGNNNKNKSYDEF